MNERLALNKTNREVRGGGDPIDKLKRDSNPFTKFTEFWRILNLIQTIKIFLIRFLTFIFKLLHIIELKLLSSEKFYDVNLDAIF